MAVIHVLKDGSIVKDIKNHIVHIKDARPLYELITNINREGSKRGGLQK